MTWWERLVYAASLAFWRAYFEARILAKEVTDEMVDEDALACAARFRDAVERLRASQGAARAEDPTPGRQGDQGGNLGGGKPGASGPTGSDAG